MQPTALPSESPRSFRQWHGWRPLFTAVAAATAGVIGFLYWYEVPVQEPPRAEPAIAMRFLPPPPVSPQGQLHRVESARENGIAVWRIVAVEDGDELIVDAATGKLLAVRDRQGKTTWLPLVAAKPLQPTPVKS